jgi:DNA-binding transcriptional ArsR family regulator
VSGRCPTCGQPLAGQLELAPTPPGPKSRAGDPDTAHAAAARSGTRAATQRLELLAALAETPWGATAEELALATELPYQSVSTRVSELKQRGLAYVQGKRQTSSGSLAGVVHARPGALADLRREPSLRSAA